VEDGDQVALVLRLHRTSRMLLFQLEGIWRMAMGLSMAARRLRFRFSSGMAMH
jgi:hypothetical protein